MVGCPWMLRVCGYLYVAVMFGFYAVHSEITQKTANVGETAVMKCNLTEPHWYKNGTRLKENQKVKPSGSTLSLFCLELSDNGFYECRDKTTMHKAKIYNLIVHNPDNLEFFHIHNKNNRKKCLSSLATFLHVEDCNLQSCRQKWAWTASRQLMNVNDFTNPMCISTNQYPPPQSSQLNLHNCSQKKLGWQCNNSLVKLKDYDLYLNFDVSSGYNVNLLPIAGFGSHWVKYTTRDDICSESRKAVVSPTHVVQSERQTVKLTCQGINFFRPSYTWLKNGEPVTNISRLSLHIHSNVMLMPFAYRVNSGNYTCVVRDHSGSATASTVVEIYKDPSIIRHSLNQSALLGNDICLTCDMFGNNTIDEISWFKMGVPISPGNPKYKVNIVPGKFKKFSTELCIRSLNHDDSGTYSCGIKSSTRRAHADGKLQVLVKPEVYIYKIDDSVLVCNATGFPLPALAWYKNSEYMISSTDNERHLTIKETVGNFTCVASNSAGTSSKSFISIPVGRNSSGRSLTLIILCVIGGIMLAVMVILCVCCYRRRKKEVVNNNYDGVYSSVRYTTAPGESASPSAYTTVDLQPPHQKPRSKFQPRRSSESDKKGLMAKYQENGKPRAKGEWEVPYECVRWNKKLGEGQFGQVWHGDIVSRNKSRTVAIKILHEGASVQDRKALIDELEFMKTLSPHPNIVGLVGCCTRSEKVLIIVEYVAGGNLKDYLLNSRGTSKETYANLAPFSATLTSKDLLTFAYQIARGMSHLEQIKCVHRDLAARNVLVGGDKTCKIADFGLARDIYKENYYRKTSGGRLPLRWMAYESIFNGITTNQSDAWSYGIVLWEIVTIGGNPYPDMNRDKVIDSLQRGYRMPKPHHCSEEIYVVMWDCWQQNPDKRPTFAELTATLLRLISLQQNFIKMECLGESDYANMGSYEETTDA